MDMKNCWLDYESYYDNDYSLKKLTPVEYILDPRFEAIGCSFWFEDEDKPFWIDGPELPHFLNGIDWSDIRAISHNAAFDMSVLAFRYDIHPAAYGCTLSMARNWIRHQIGRCDLKTCAKRYGMEKGDAILNMKGVNYHALNGSQYDEFTEYCCNDTRICHFLWTTFLEDGFPVSELDVIDWTIRMVVQPALEIDLIRVAEHLASVKAQKQQLLDAAGLEDRTALMSDELLAGILIELGVDPPPMKVSPTTNEMIWAFAKTDLEFTDLENHEDPKVQAVVAARLGHRSTIEESRAERFMAISHMTEAMPIPLNYSGAHTHRFSGAWSLNMQNLPNGSKLREAIRAPKGCVVVSVDASQIEARLNATLSGETWLVEAFKEGRDVYCEFADLIYMRKISKADKNERFVGKTGILSLGYGSSWPVFQRMVRNKGGIVLTDDDAARIVKLYRNMNAAIVEHWSEAKEVILMMEHGEDFIWGSLQIEREALVLPNGNKLRYHNLRKEQLNGRKQWVYNQGPLMKRLYGAKVVENECQSLAFLHIAEVAMRVKKLTDGMLLPCHQIHDELLYCVPETMGEKVKRLVVQEMSKSPAWLPDAPLSAEGHIGETYGGAK
jgi:DNA polymerase family A